MRFIPSPSVVRATEKFSADHAVVMGTRPSRTGLTVARRDALAPMGVIAAPSCDDRSGDGAVASCASCAGLHSQPSHEGERMRPGSRETWIEHVVILRALRGAGPAVHSRRRLQVRALGARNLRAGIEAPEPAPGRHYMEKSAGAQVCSHLAARAVPSAKSSGSPARSRAAPSEKGHPRGCPSRPPEGGLVSFSRFRPLPTLLLTLQPFELRAEL